MLLLPTARALAMWVFYLDILQNFTSYCPQHKTCCHHPDHPLVTSFHCSISVVQSVLLSIVSIWIGPKSVCNVIHIFFKSVFFKFPGFNVTIVTLTNRVTFLYINVLCCRVTVVVHLLSRRVMISGLRLVLCHLVLRLVARWDSLLVSPGLPASSTGFHQSLALVLAKRNNRDKESKAQLDLY